MVLVNGHTIYKSIANDYKFDDIVDSLNNIDYTQEHTNRRKGKSHHKFRRNEPETAEAKSSGLAIRDIQDFLQFIGTTPQPPPHTPKKKQKSKATKKPSKEKTEKKSKHHKFWSKFHRKSHENKSKKPTNVGGCNNGFKNKYFYITTSLKSSDIVETKEHYDETTAHYLDLIEYNEDGHRTLQRRRKHIPTENQIETYRDADNNGIKDRSITDDDEKRELQFLKNNKETLKNARSNTPIAVSDRDSLTTALSQMTHKISKLKEQYGMSQITSKQSSIFNLTPLTIANENAQENVLRAASRSSSNDILIFDDMQNETLESAIIAEIESLLTEMKRNELKFIEKENPSVTNLITNTVTEATFYADIYSGATLSDFNDTANMKVQETKHKRATPVYNDDVIKISNNTARSIKDDTLVIAQGIEDKLQCELKSAYKRIKAKLCHDFHEEMERAKSNVTALFDRKTKQKPKLSKTTEWRKIRNSNTNTSEITSTSHTIPIVGDDNVMISLYEQLISKSHEDNIWKMLSTQSIPLHEKDNEQLPSHENRVDSLNEDADNLYKEEEMPDEYLDTGQSTKRSAKNEDTSTGTEAEDTSYEALSNKISYKDYVNGYKYYLNFQNTKDQDEQKYSNLVRYQAHKHHKVDDIGKYILEKIPNVQTTKKRRRFVESGTLEDQEISTKSEDSWFKKHFFVFIDKETPKKFKSFQTVSLKPQTSPFPSVTADLKITTKLDEAFGTKAQLKFIPNLLKQHAKRISFKDNGSEDTEIEDNFDRYYGTDEFSQDTHTRRKRKSKSKAVGKANVSNNQQKEKITVSPNTKQCGYVGLDFINKPTAVVRLHGSRNNKHRFKNLLGKMHLRKKVKSKIEKREQTRAMRFNPMKKLKEIFSVTEEQTAPNIVSADYEHSTNENTPSAQYIQYLKVSDLLNQVPNITEEKLNSGKVDEAYVKKILSEQKLRDKNMPIDSTEDFTKQDYNQKNAFNDQSSKSSIPQTTEELTTTTVQYNDDSIFDVVIRNMKPPNPYLKQFSRVDSKSNDMRDKLDNKIQIILTTKDRSPATTMLSQFMIPFEKNINKHEAIETPERMPKELSVRTKLTRVAKYPKKHKHDKNVTNAKLNERPQVYELYKQDSILTISQEDIPAVLEKPTSTFKADLKATVKSKKNDKSALNVGEIKRKSIPDYFNDLILWHNDILNENYFSIPPEESVKEKSESKDESVKKHENLEDQDPNRNLFKIDKPSSDEKNHSSKNNISVKENRDFSKILRYTRSSMSSNPVDDNMDTTVVAYDDSLIDFEENYDSKKNSKNSHHDSNPEFGAKTLAKINAAPQQYFNTPLPMTMTDFDNFLKENKIDVKSVTAPMSELPDISPLFARKSFVSKVLSKATITEQDVTGLLKKMMNNADSVNLTQDKETTKFSKIDKFNDSHKFTPKIDDKFKDQITQKVMYTKGKYAYPNTMSQHRRLNFSRQKRYDKKYKTRKICNDKIHFYKNKEKDDLQNIPTKSPTKDSMIEPIKNSNAKEVDLTVIDLNDINIPVRHMETFDSIEHNNLKDSNTKSWHELGKKFFQQNILHKNDQFLTVTDTTTEPNSITIKVVNDPEVLNSRDVKKKVDSTKITISGALKAKDIEKIVDTATTKVIEGLTAKDDNKIGRATNKVAGKLNCNDAKKIIDAATTDVAAGLNANEDNKITNNENKIAKTKDFKLIDSAQGKPSVLFLSGQNNKQPKRIHITGHTCAYDIVYHEPLNNIKKEYQNVWQFTKNLAKSILHSNKDEEYENRLESSTASLRKDEVMGKGILIYDLKEDQPDAQIKQKRFKKLSDLLMKLKSHMQNINGDTIPEGTSVPTGAYNISTTVEQTVTVSAENKGSNQIVDSFKEEYIDYDSNDLKEVMKPTETKRSKGAMQFSSTQTPISLTVPYNNEFLKRKSPLDITISVDTVRPTDENANVIVKTNGIVTNARQPEYEGVESTQANFKVPLGKIEKVPIEIAFNDDTSISKEAQVDDEIYYEPIIKLKKKKRTFKKDRHKIVTEAFIKATDIKPLQLGWRPDPAKYYKSTAQPKNEYNEESNSNVEAVKHPKRDLQIEATFTAKDVAALEVVIDLVRDTLNYEQKNVPKTTEPLSIKEDVSVQSCVSPKPKTKVTNSIQVHIAIPLNFNDKKRSLGPSKIRRVFSAFMSSPVDIKYQIHSFEDTTPLFTPSNDALSPGLYLLVNNKDLTMPKGNFNLKPIQSEMLKNVNLENTELFSTPTPIINTLISENNTTVHDMEAAEINKELFEKIMELYRNLTQTRDQKMKREATKTIRSSNNPNESKKNFKNPPSKLVNLRRINWDSIKKYFGHDRVCSCHCKANKTMCRACAASDAVISELIFEFENMGKYMRDHCTEIQTFFWMNPSGGRKLKEAVHRIEKTLDDYYKRVKGKCQGKTCTSFFYTGKRNVATSNNVGKNTANNSIAAALETLAMDVERAYAYESCNENLFLKGTELLDEVTKCVPIKLLHKRSDGVTKSKGKYVKQVYSLDNINVNIICNTDVPVTENQNNIENISTDTYDLNGLDTMPIFYDSGYVGKNMKKSKENKWFFKKKSNKKAKVYKFNNVIDIEPNVVKKSARKRQITENNQIESPLNTDSGGSFWHDYIKSKAYQLSLNRKATVCSEFKNKVSNKLKQYFPTLGNSDESTEIDLNEKKSNITDSLSQNIEDLSKIMGLDNVDKAGLSKSTSSMKKKSKFRSKSTKLNKSKALASNTTSTRKKATSKTSHKTKSLSTSKLPPSNATSTKMTGVTRVKSKEKAKSLKTNHPKTSFHTNTKVTTPEMSSKRPRITRPTPHATTMRNIFNRIKSVTSKFLHGNSDQKSKTNAVKSTKKQNIISDRYIRNPAKVEKTSAINTVTKDFPTIVIMDNVDDRISESSANIVDSNVNDSKNMDSPKNSRDILFSILNSESDHLKEWDKCAKKNRLEEDSAVTSNDSAPVKTVSVTTVTTAGINDRTNTSDKLINKLLIKLLLKKGMMPSEKAVNNQRNDKMKAKVKFEIKDNIKQRSPKNYKKGHGYICDILGTIKYILNMHQKLSQEDFESYVKNIKCTKYKIVPDYFLVELPYKLYEEKRNIEETTFQNSAKKPVRWNWVRHKRLAFDKYGKVDDDVRDNIDRNKPKHYANHRTRNNLNIKQLNSPTKNDLRNVYEDTYYENFYRTKNGIYKICKQGVKKALNDNKFSEATTSSNIYNIIEINRPDFIKDDNLKFESPNAKDDLIFETNIDAFENLCKNEEGVYNECKSRHKRDTDISDLIRGLKRLPRLQPQADEVYAMVGDTVSLSCCSPDHGSLEFIRDRTVCEAEREDMLGYDNVAVGNATVVIKGVGARNSGKYICRNKDNAVVRNVRLTMITVPAFDVVFPLIYTPGNCSYQDLTSMKRLGTIMSRTVCGSHCSVNINEPVCLKDETNRSFLRSTASMTMSLPSLSKCSAECKRDLLCGLVLLAVTTVPSLQAVGVVISHDGFNKTLTPANGVTKRAVVTHTIRSESQEERKYHKLGFKMDPGDIDVVVACPGGYFLITDRKICVICPENTWSADGDNSCYPCPVDEESLPGASSCQPSERLARSCKWRWLLYVYGALASCAVSVASAFAVMLTRRFRRPSHVRFSRFHGVFGRPYTKGKKRKSPRRRASAPSRVLLSELLIGTSSSDFITDAHDDRKLWKTKSTPPPLPPYDF